MPDPLVRASDGWTIQLEKADPHVDYKMAGAGADHRCGNCRFYNAAGLECNLVEGSISPSCVCDLWTAPMDMSTNGMGMMWGEPKDHPFSVFVEARTLSDLSTAKASWIPFLPKPGKFNHPLYGEINITPMQNQQMVDSVRNHVYQEHIPLDAEHETKLSGAVAWIKDMRLNDDGSADAYVEWTDRGRTLVGGDSPQYKYVSPEWFDQWRDPATGIVHANVVAGGAITTRPFFKDKVLRALVASEDGVTIIKEEPHVPNPDTKAAAGDGAKPDDKPDAKPDQTPVTFSEEQVKEQIAAAVTKALAENQPKPADDTSKFAELNARVAAAEAVAASEKQARESLATALVDIQNRERRQRFSELVEGRGGSNDGGAWVGESAAQVSFLEKLADQVGETSEMFTGYVTQQNAVAAQMATAALFSEVGSTASAPIGGNTDDKIEGLAKARMAADPKLTHAKAYSEALSSPEGARLYQEGEQAKQRARRP